MTCRRCDGRGEVYVALRPVECEACGGTGHLRGPLDLRLLEEAGLPADEPVRVRIAEE